MRKPGSARVIVAAVCLLASAVPVRAAPLGSGFTYQGRLRHGGSAVNGAADLQFSLWDAASGGVQIGTTQTLGAIPVSEGLFAVELNGGGECGPAVFNGQARWLEITVAYPAGGGGFVTLSPRQPITPGPYALRAMSGGGDGHSLDAVDGSPADAVFVDPQGRVGVGTTGPAWKLHVAGGVHDGVKVSVPDGANTSAQVVLSAGSEPQFGQGAIFQLNAPSTTPDPNALILLNRTNGPLVLGTNNQRMVDILPSGRVGIGTTDPVAALHAVTSDVIGVYGETKSSSPSSIAVMGWALASVDMDTYGGYFQSDARRGMGVTGFASSSTGPTFGGHFRTLSTDGVGVYGHAPAPAGTTYGAWGESASPAGTGVFGRASSSTGNTVGVHGEVRSDAGTGVFGQALSTTGGTFAGRFENRSVSGSGVLGSATATTGVTYGGQFETWSPAGEAVLAVAKATTGAANAIHGHTDSPEGTGVWGAAASATGRNWGVYGQTGSPEGVGVQGVAAASSGWTYGVLGKSASQIGAGVLGRATNEIGFGATGVHGETWSEAGIGVRGEAIAQTGTAVGGLFTSSSNGGEGVSGWASAQTGATWGGRFGSFSDSGTGVSGGAFAYTGATYGWRFENRSDSGVGVHAEVSSSTGATRGVIALSHSPNGIGVQAVKDAPTGPTAAVAGSVTSNKGYAVVGIAASTEDDAANAGVFGQNSNPAPSAFAVYAKGKFAATGTKSFVVDHPLDPANKVLQHFCTEGPEPINTYRGRATLDDQGAAVVRLPDYFEAINADFEYQLTPVGASMPSLHVAAEVANNAFRIAGGKPGGRVSWCVSGRRIDGWVKAHGTPAEFAKPADLKGNYLNAEQFVPADEVSARSAYGFTAQAKRAARQADTPLADDRKGDQSLTGTYPRLQQFSPWPRAPQPSSF